MPLPPANPLRLEINNFQGIDIERGKLERPEDSFRRLENFDLVKPGVIKKCKGNVQLGEIAAGEVAVAFRDFQRVSSGQELLMAVSNAGKLYFAIGEASAGFNLVGSLYSPPSLLDEAPFIVCLPFDEGEDKVQYVVVTVGTKGTVKKWSGGNIVNLGVENPTDTWTVPYQHGMIAAIYGSREPGRLDYLTDNKSFGIPVNGGKRYRWAWYNPTTKHLSSLAALNQREWIIAPQNAIPDLGKITKPAGVVIGIGGFDFAMAVPLVFDNLPTSETVEAITPPEGYTKIGIFTTTNGGTTYFLLPRVYDKDGALISDEEGFIDVDDARYGYTISPNGGFDSPVFYDGFIPIESAGPLQPDTDPTDGVVGTVNGPGQTGGDLTVNFSAAFQAGFFWRGRLKIEGDPTVYVIVSYNLGTNTLTVGPPIVTAPADGATITFQFTPPVADNELLRLFAPVGESPNDPNIDRINDPPPMASWGVVYSNRLMLLSPDKTSLVYSLIGQYESFPPSNIFRFTQADFDPITALLAGRQVGEVSVGADQRLVIGKPRSTAQLTGNGLENFEIGYLFPETGIIHKRAAIVVGGFMLIWSRQGLELIEAQRPVFIGTKIKDIIDAAEFDDTYGPSFITKRKDNLVLLGMDLNVLSIEDPDLGDIDTIIMMREPIVGEQGVRSPFSEYTSIPRIAVLHESGLGPDVKIIAGGNDGHVYELFRGGENQAITPPVPIIAIAETQELPQNDKDSRKTFRRVRFEGNIEDEFDVVHFKGWKIEFSVDKGLHWTSPKRMFRETLIGLTGKTLIMRISHDRKVLDSEDEVILSNFALDYATIGEAR